MSLQAGDFTGSGSTPDGEGTPRVVRVNSLKPARTPEKKQQGSYVPSAPAAEGKIRQQRLEQEADEFIRREFLSPDFPSFRDFIMMTNELKAETGGLPPWVRKPDSLQNIIDYAENKDTQLPDWIRRPNAEKDADMMLAVNGHQRMGSNVIVNLGGTVVERGEIVFIRNNTKFEIRGEGRYRFYAPYISVLGRPRKLTETHIQQGPITITMILPGKIGIALLDNKPIILLPGRHAFNNPLFLFDRTCVYDITRPMITFSSTTLINIKADQVGFARLDNSFYLLTPGLHFSNDPAFVHEVTFTIAEDEHGQLAKLAHGDEKKYGVRNNQAYVQVGTITLCQVHPSEFGCAYVDGFPKFLRPGFYARNSASFSFTKAYKSNSPSVTFGTLHLLNVRKGKLALVTDRNMPLLVEGPSQVMKNSPLFEFVRMVPADRPKIVHRSITRYVIETAFIGFAHRRGIVEKLEPGIAVVDDPDFYFIGVYPAKQKLIQQGQFTLVTVQDGNLLPVWEDGILEMVKPGFKMFQTPNVVVGPVVDLYPPIITFRKIDAYTRDRSQMQISGQLEYVVEDAHLLVTSIGVDEMIKSLEKRIHAILRHHLAITDLSSISSEHRGVQATGIQTHVPTNKEDGEPDFRDELGEQATKELQADASRWGIRVIKMEVSDIHYKDEEVEHAIADRTTKTRIAESDFDLSVVKNRQTIVEVQAHARKLYIEAESKANQELLTKRGDVKTFRIENDITLARKKASVEANKLAVVGSARAQANQVLTEAKAAAKAVEIRADANLTAMLKDAEGEEKLLEVMHDRYGGPGSLLQLEKMKLKIKYARALAKAAVPTVSLNATGGAGAPTGSRGQLAELMKR